VGEKPLRDFVSHELAMGVTTSIQADRVEDLRVVKEGLSMVLDMGITCLEIEPDSPTAIELIQSNKSTNTFFRPIVDEFRYLTIKFHTCSPSCNTRSRSLSKGEKSKKKRQILLSRRIHIIFILLLGHSA
jgi:hypothetical protein